MLEDAKYLNLGEYPEGTGSFTVSGEQEMPCSKVTMLTIKKDVEGNSGTGSFTVSNKIRNEYVIFPQNMVLYDYLTTDGNSWIDTGIDINDTLYDVDCKWEKTSSSEIQGLFWYRVKGSGYPSFMCITPANSTTTVRVAKYSNGSNSAGNIMTVSDNSVVTYRTSGDTFTLNDISGTFKTTPTLFGSRELRIPARYLADMDTDYTYYAVKIHHLKLYNGDTLLRNYIPCTYNNEAGMYDLVEGKFYGNSGTGSFTVGNE